MARFVENPPRSFWIGALVLALLMLAALDPDMHAFASGSSGTATKLGEIEEPLGSEAREGSARLQNALTRAKLPTLPAIGTEAQDKNFSGERQPDLSPIELEIERTPQGKYRIRSVDPNGPYADLVKANDEFDSIADIPTPPAAR